MLSLVELERAARILDRDFAGARVERWLQPDGEQLVATLYRREPGDEDERTLGVKGVKRHLLFNAALGAARLSELAATPHATDQPPGLTAYLRAHLSRARLVRAGIRDRDRQLAIRFEAKEGEFELLLSLFGRRSNVYLLDAEGRIRATLRPLAETRAELAHGAPFASPAGALPDAGRDRFADVPDAEYLNAIEEHYAGRASEQGASELARRLLKAIRKEKKNAERRLERVEAELAEADEASVLQRQGDLLKVSLAEVRPGASEVRVRDFETNADVVIPLDPARSAKANLEAIFKRYHKLLRRLTKAGGQLDAARSWMGEIEALEARCSELAAQADPVGAASAGVSARASATAELEQIAARPEIAKLLDRPAPARRDEPSSASTLPARLRDVPRSLLPRRYRSRDGLEIWVGRSDEGNDHLSTRLAVGRDLFFHLDGAPGSHVILRTEGRPDPPQESVLDACELAVHFSKHKNASRADVHVVPVHNVRKPRGAKKGLVTVTGGKTVHLRREEIRLARVLSSRIDD